jgi:putative nucleotidyltransferase with HDIG domain
MNNISLDYSFINHEREMEIEKNLKRYLIILNKENLFQYLSYILKEMVGNANKANLKRVFFFQKDLNIKSNIHYEEGMKTFKDEINENYKLYQSIAEQRGYFIKINLFTKDNDLIISVINNVSMIPIEKERIESKLKKASKFKSIEDALSDGIDQTEGAGLGLILTALMLRKFGLDESVLKIDSRENLTQFLLKIPLSLLNEEEEDFIANEVKKEIEVIPQFPQHILELQKILSNPNANFSDLAHIINRDPSLIADLLKTANSSMYMLPNKVKTIDEAVKMIGFKGVKNLVWTYSAQKLLSEKYNFNIIKDTIDHSAEVAFYAYELAKHFKFKEIIDEIFTAAILHDLGKIIINSLKPDVLSRITKICNKKGINSSVIENLTDGFNHSIIGARLAEKWNFPESIIESIKYHHIPLEASEKHQKIVYLIYLANLYYYYKRNEIYYQNINYQVLSFLNLTDENNFISLFSHIDKTFEKKLTELKNYA